MTQARNPYLRKSLLLAAVVLAFDQASKFLMQAIYAALFLMGESPPIRVTPFFNLGLVWNAGVSFGMLSGLDARWPLAAMTLAIAAFLLVWLWRGTDALTAAALGMILGGALGNLVDRIRFGAVFDFLDFHLLGYHWPAFNAADACIVLGVALLVWRSFRPESA